MEFKPVDNHYWCAPCCCSFVFTCILKKLCCLFSDAPLITISSFAPQLTVITSKQRPRKLTIHGSDGEDYAFLLKGHEDLRQDERVMQVLLLKPLCIFWQIWIKVILKASLKDLLQKISAETCESISFFLILVLEI